MHKLSHLVDGEWVGHTYDRLYARETTSGGDRITVGLEHDAMRVFERLVAELADPLFLLYVLHTPRGEAEPGRYQSPEITAKQVQACLAMYGSFLSADARFDLWVHSDRDDATIVWDRHDVICAYGPLDRFVSVLTSLGYQQGTVSIPTPHMHHYRKECDTLATALVRNQDWLYEPLRPEEVQ